MAMRGRFVVRGEVPAPDQKDWGTVSWVCNPVTTEAEQLTVTDVTIDRGKGHDFHKHPRQDEVIVVVEGEIEQWLEQEKRLLRPGTPGGQPAYSPNGMTWVYLKPLAKNELPDGVRDGYFRDAQNTVHVWTRHLTYFAILKPGPTLKLIAAPHIWAINKRRTIAFLVQSGRPVTGVAQLYVAHSKHNVTLWKPFSVKAGATVIRMYLPKNHKMLGKYELRAKFTIKGQKTKPIRKRTIDFLPKRYKPVGRPIVLRVNGLDNHTHLAKTLRRFYRVGYFRKGPSSIPFAAIAKKDVAAVVIDSTRSPYDYDNRIGLIRNLRWIFPDLRIVVISDNKTFQEKAKKWGADAVSRRPGGSWQLRLSIRRALASLK